jgi:YidC/Oxa1 family membrane protein insertase
VLWALDGLHDALGIGYGWVLILFGVLIRILLWPLNAKAMRSQLKTMELQPMIKKIQAKYKNEPEKLQREMIRLYEEEGFNPLGGCLPLLLPRPILRTRFFGFQNTIAFRGQGFLWLPDLSQPDPLYILPLLMGASIFLLQWLNLKVNPDPTPQMKMLTYFMPVMLTVLFLNFASGLNLYYAASNLASLPQQLQIMGERKKLRKKIG